MTEHYILYGSYASYYTAKSRAYLRKKGIPFLERLPSDPRFRNFVRPKSGSHRIPQLETPEGEVVQDSTAIFDLLEARFPDVPALPVTPLQRTAAHLMELLASEGLVRLAWQYRWFHEDNLHFVKMDFGRSFKPQGSDEELLHYGNLIADRMLSRGNIKYDNELLAEMESQFKGLLDVLEQHFQYHPFMLGGHPSIADYAIMGALHAHMGRDPVPLHFMQKNAPRVFRWVEHMFTPEIQSPEFPERAISYEPDDALPDSFKPVLAYLLELTGARFFDEAQAFNAYVVERGAVAGALIHEDDQPMIVQKVEGREIPFSVLNIWLLQRSLNWYRSLESADRQRVSDALTELGGGNLINVESAHAVERVENRFRFA